MALHPLTLKYLLHVAVILFSLANHILGISDLWTQYVHTAVCTLKRFIAHC